MKKIILVGLLFFNACDDSTNNCHEYCAPVKSIKERVEELEYKEHSYASQRSVQAIDDVYDNLKDRIDILSELLKYKPENGSESSVYLPGTKGVVSVFSSMGDPASIDLGNGLKRTYTSRPTQEDRVKDITAAPAIKVKK